MTTLYSLTLATATANLRTDLNDPAGASQRWADADLQRALDRAVERITTVEPDLEEIQVQTQQRVRDYLKPTNALWIDRVEYPAGQWPPSYPAFRELRSAALLPPLVQPSIAAGPFPGSGLPAGSHLYAATWTDAAAKETILGPSASITTTSNQAVTIAEPVFPEGATLCNIYRTYVNTSSPFRLLNSIAIGSGTLVDSTADAGLIAIFPPGSNTTGGDDIFRLEVPPEQYPPDTTSFVLSVRYALKHRLDSSGTTIPERHWDTLYLGAKVAAVDMYLANINDNFVYADGQLRDRVDDTKSVDAWRAFRDLLDQQFVSRLKLIRDEQIQSARFTPVWGDKPLRWERV